MTAWKKKNVEDTGLSNKKNIDAAEVSQLGFIITITKQTINKIVNMVVCNVFTTSYRTV